MTELLDKYVEGAKQYLQCGFCRKRFPVDVKVGMLIDHLCEKHRIRTLAEFCFLQAFIKVTSVPAKERGNKNEV